jgi:hypothetical protein
MGKRIIKSVARELYGLDEQSLTIPDLRSSNFIKKEYFKKLNSKQFQISSFGIKLLLDQSDGSKIYSMKNTHSILKQTTNSEEKWLRTSTSFKDDEELVKRNKNNSSVQCYRITLNRTQYITDKEMEESKNEKKRKKMEQEKERKKQIEKYGSNLGFEFDEEDTSDGGVM